MLGGMQLLITFIFVWTIRLGPQLMKFYGYYYYLDCDFIVKIWRGIIIYFLNLSVQICESQT